MSEKIDYRSRFNGKR